MTASVCAQRLRAVVGGVDVELLQVRGGDVELEKLLFAAPAAWRPSLASAHPQTAEPKLSVELSPVRPHFVSPPRQLTP